MTESLRTLAAVIMSTLAIVIAQSPTASAGTVPNPPRPAVALPQQLDAQASYQGQTTCDPVDKPGPIAFAEVLNRTYGTHRFGISRPCLSNTSEHYEGRALDWMIDANDPEQRAVADSIVAWLSGPDEQGREGAIARRLGINYIIWNRQAWRGYAPERGWRAYTGSSPHTDHIHISFTWDGAYQRTSWWTGKALMKVSPGPDPSDGTNPPAPSPREPIITKTGYELLRLGSTGKDVRVLQRGLEVKVDGDFGARTEHSVTGYQEQESLVPDGVVGTNTWTSLIDTGRVPPKSGAPKPVPPPKAGPHPELEQYAGTLLRYGSRGDAVSALQGVLSDLVVDGIFGRLTLAAVKSYQKEHGLEVDGIVGPKTWTSLIAG